MTITWSLATITANKKGGGRRQMHLIRRLFQWPLRCARSNTDGITQCGMSRATLEATGRHHWATTCSVSPQRPPGQQANKQQSTNTPTKLAVLMAMAMHRYVIAHIARWRRSRASLEVTGRRHWVSIMPNNIHRSWIRRFFLMFSSSKP